MNNIVLLALIATLGTWLVTALGAATVVFFRSPNPTGLNLMLGFASGVMIAASFWSLLQPAIERAEAMAVYRDILWPGLCSAIEKRGAHLTCYLAPQFHYKDNNFPQVGQLVFYLRQMREKGAEAGLTMEYV